ncbi:hypothetical protein [Sphaerotilus sp.]|uniref:hypothetical protein n=1 Tax=Sphaerotilus sp. TaxID=2093942 RepID=UPI0034E2CB48
MPRKFLRPKVPSSLSDGDIGLAMKDGLREIRFNLKRGAHKLVEGVQTASHRDDSTTLGRFGEPLGLAVRTTAQLLRSADHAAVDLLSSDGHYRAMDIPLCPSATYFSAEHTIDPIRLFTRDHHWRYRHLLSLRGTNDLFVYEQRIERAGQQLRSAASPGKAQAEHLLHAPPSPHQLSARIVLALQAADVLTPAIDTAEATEEPSLNDHAALCVVLAGELAPLIPGPVRQQTEMALRLADEVCSAHQAVWTQALGSSTPDTALAAWIAFALRYI